MKFLTDIDIQRAAMLKAARAAIRLKHALAADAEIAKRLPELESAIDYALQTGKAYELNVGEEFNANFSA